MSTELAERPKATNGILMSVTEETIQQMATRMLTLKVNGVADKQGYELCEAARKECVKARSGITNEHKMLKEESLRVGQALDAEKRRLLARVEPIEAHLNNQLEIVKQEEARIKKANEDAAYAIRLQLLTTAGGSMPEDAIRGMTDSQFQLTVMNAAAATKLRREAAEKAAAEEAERKRIADEQAEANRLESLRLTEERAKFERERAAEAAERQRLQAIEDERRAVERAELEAQRQEQARQAAELQAEKNRLAKIESDRQAAIEQQRIATETAERVRIETEERIRREAQIAEQTRLAQEAAEKRAGELRPAKAKLNEFAHSIMNLPVPGVSKDVDARVQAVLNVAAEFIRKIATSLS